MTQTPFNSSQVNDSIEQSITGNTVASLKGDALQFSGITKFSESIQDYLKYYNSFITEVEVSNNANKYINTYDSLEDENYSSRVKFRTAEDPVFEIKFTSGGNGLGYYNFSEDTEYGTYMGADTSDAITNTLLTLFLDEEQMYKEWWPEDGVDLKEISIEGAIIELDGKRIQTDILQNYKVTNILKENLEMKEKDLKEEKEKSEELKFQLDHTTDELNEEIKTSKELNEKLGNVHEELEASNQYKEYLSKQLTEKNIELNTASGKISQLNSQLTNAQDDLRDSQEDIADLKDDLFNVNNDLKDAEKEIDDLIDKHADKMEDLNKEHEKAVYRLEDKIERYDEQVDELSRTNRGLNEELGKINEDKKNLEEKFNIAVDSNNELKDKNRKLDSENNDLSKKLKDKTTAYNYAVEENNELENAYNALHDDLAQVHHQLNITTSLLTHEPQAKDYKAKLPNGKDLILNVGEVKTGLSFGEKYTELVVDKYPYFDYDKDDFTVNKVAIGSGEKISAEKAGISVDEKGLWSINTNLPAYQNLPTTGRKVTDVTVDFTVSDPLNRTDTGTVSFGVIKQPPQNSESNVILDTTVKRAGNIGFLKGWRIAEGYANNDMVKNWGFGVVADEDVIDNSSSSQIFAAANSYAKDSDNYYVVDVTAKAKGDYKINSVDLNFTFDSSKFEWVGTNIDDSFDIFNTTSNPSNPTSADNLSTLRVVGGSAHNLTRGAAGIRGDIEGNIFTDPGGEIIFPDDTSAFKVLLKAKHDKSTLGKSEDIEFKTSLNSTDTILTSMSNVENIVNGVADTHDGNFTFSSSHVAFKAKNDIKFATKKSIGIVSDYGVYTSLVREGAELESLGSISFVNKGNIQSDYKAVITNTKKDEESNKILPHEDVFAINFADEDSTKMVTGNVNHSNAEKNYKLELLVKGKAGEIIDLDGVNVEVTNQAQDDLQITKLTGKNLITYKSDINYDGRVSMSDLAYLNAGAARNTYSEDVDVNMDDKISMDDLAMMDKEWGSSLHEKNPLIGVGDTTFMGKDNSEIDLSYELIGNHGMIDNSAFINQNKIEQMDDFEGSLAVAGSQGYTDPWEGQNNYDEVQDDYPGMK